MKILLRLKDWKLFLLIFGLPLLFQTIFIWVVLTNMPSGPVHASLIYSYVIYGILLLIISSVIFLSWLWGIGAGLQHMIPKNLRLPTTLFRIAVLIPVIYLITMGIIAGSMMSPNKENLVLGHAGLFILLILFHLAAVFGMFYAIYFAAKTLRTTELQRPVTILDFAGDFFFIWFYPIGIWIIQPRLNKLLRKK